MGADAYIGADSVQAGHDSARRPGRLRQRTRTGAGTGAHDVCPFYT